MISDYTKLKTPHFFIYAKDKTPDKVEPINSSVVNRLSNVVLDPLIRFKKAGLGKFDYKMLMRNKGISVCCIAEGSIEHEIINMYQKLDLKKRFSMSELDDSKSLDALFIYGEIREKLNTLHLDLFFIVDVLIEYLYGYKKSKYKTTLWSSFGDLIVENLKQNILMKNIYCSSCGDIIAISGNRHMYCKNCFAENRKKYKAEKEKEYRKQKRGHFEKNLKDIDMTTS